MSFSAANPIYDEKQAGALRAAEEPFRGGTMKPYGVFRKTIIFSWLKLLLCFAYIVLCTVLFAVLVGLGSLASDVLAAVMFVVWIPLCAVVYYTFRQYLGFLVETGHIAAAAGFYSNSGRRSEQVSDAAEYVMRRFVSAQNYFICERMVRGAAGQLRRAGERSSENGEDIPGIAALNTIGAFVQHLLFRYPVSWCMSFALARPHQPLLEALADGTAVFAVRYRKLMKKASEITVAMAVFMVVGTVALSFLFLSLFRLMSLDQFSYFAVILAFAVVYSLKYAFFDSLFFIKTLRMYLNEASHTRITEPVRKRLCRMSRAYRILLGNARRSANRRVAAVENGGTMTLDSAEGRGMRSEAYLDRRR